MRYLPSVQGRVSGFDLILCLESGGSFEGEGEERERLEIGVERI